MPHEVFISYASHDKAVADAACEALEAQKISCWIAPRNLPPGTEYGEMILNAISSCHILVIIFSSHANASPQVRREVERATSKGKTILPFRVENVAPSRSMEYFLSNTQWFDALTPPIEAHFVRLADSVLTLITQQHLNGDLEVIKQSVEESAFSSQQTPKSIDSELSNGAGIAVITEKIPIEIRIDRDFNKYTKEDATHLLKVIQELLGLSDEIKLLKIKRGSVLIVINLEEEQADKLSALIDAGVLHKYGVVDVLGLQRNTLPNNIRQ